MHMCHLIPRFEQESGRGLGMRLVSPLQAADIVTKFCHLPVRHCCAEGCNYSAYKKWILTTYSSIVSINNYLDCIIMVLLYTEYLHINSTAPQVSPQALEHGIHDNRQLSWAYWGPNSLRRVLYLYTVYNSVCDKSKLNYVQFHTQVEADRSAPVTVCIAMQ